MPPRTIDAEAAAAVLAAKDRDDDAAPSVRLHFTTANAATERLLTERLPLPGSFREAPPCVRGRRSGRRQCSSPASSATRRTSCVERLKLLQEGLAGQGAVRASGRPASGPRSVVRAPLGPGGPRRQQRLRPGERPARRHLRHETLPNAPGRIHVEADDIPQPLEEPGLPEWRKGFRAACLQGTRTPDTRGDRGAQSHDSRLGSRLPSVRTGAEALAVRTNPRSLRQSASPGATQGCPSSGGARASCGSDGRRPPGSRASR